MTLSVLMSVYYKENPQYLDECLKSLFDQTRSADEIVCVKDGLLTAELDIVLGKWKELLPLKIVGYEQNKGLAHALNFGIQYCTGELIARIDTDDIADDKRFEAQLEFFVNNPATVILGTGITEVYCKWNGGYFKRDRIYPDRILKDSTLLYRGTPLGHPTVMVKKNLLNQYRYNEMVGANEDIDLWFRILMDGYEIRNLQECFYFQRLDDNSFKRRSYQKAINEYKIYTQMLYKIHGFSFRLIFPLLRFLSRLMPSRINKMLYISRIRNILFSK